MILKNSKVSVSASVFLGIMFFSGCGGNDLPLFLNFPQIGSINIISKALEVRPTQDINIDVYEREHEAYTSNQPVTFTIDFIQYHIGNQYYLYGLVKTIDGVIGESVVSTSNNGNMNSIQTGARVKVSSSYNTVYEISMDSKGSTSQSFNKINANKLVFTVNKNDRSFILSNVYIDNILKSLNDNSSISLQKNNLAEIIQKSTEKIFF